MTDLSDAECTDPERTTKRAVVLIHGMGDQSPMATLRGFVDAVWTSDEEVAGKNAKSWTVPDAILESREVRRITTPPDRDCVRTDFYEFYWAHLIRQTRLSSVLWWLWHVLGRMPWSVPSELRARLLIGWFAVLAISVMLVTFGWSVLAAAVRQKYLDTWMVEFPAALFLLGCIPLVLMKKYLLAAMLALGSIGGYLYVTEYWFNDLQREVWVPLLAVVAMGFGLWFLRRRVLVDVVGDAARYLTPLPLNVSARSEIRESGLRLIRGLHDKGIYDRIIVVGHSLGSVIGLDILSLYWTDVSKTLKHSGVSADALRAIERAGLCRKADASAGRQEPFLSEKLADACRRHAGPGKAGMSVDAYRNAQREYAGALAKMTTCWRITDLVTLGSPLAHAHFLMVDDRRTKPAKSEVDRAKEEWVGRYLGLASKRPNAFERIARVFAVRAHQREFAMSPPQTEAETNPCPPLQHADDRDSDTFSYKLDGAEACVPHHAAVFAPVRWTNLYAPCTPLLYGDPIAGPVAPVFGPGAKDVPISSGAGRKWIAHTRYWDPPMKGKDGSSHLELLRQAVNLRDRGSSDAA